MFNKVENTTYSKNDVTGNIINNDVAGYNARKRVIYKNKKDENRISKLESSVLNMETMLSQILEAMNK